ncbi:glycosyl transferase family 90 [Niabella terrae]
MHIQQTNKLFYYLQGYYNLIAGNLGFRKSFPKALDRWSAADRADLYDRVNYYNKMPDLHLKPDLTSSLSIAQYNRPMKPSAYFFDLIRYLRFFDRNLRLHHLFGDITFVPEQPTLVKSRPVRAGNENSILLNLNRARHFKFVEDDLDFEKKNDRLIGRGVITQPHRIAFYEKYFDHPLCDLGQVNTSGGNNEWIKPPMSIEAQLRNKFILCLEGNDVATNLKWVMSSNSIAVMPLPSYETWFMEGRLQPDEHYICIRQDFEDLEDKLQYYRSNPQAAARIVKSANRYVNQFRDRKREDMIALMVLRKYFIATGQLSGDIINTEA